MGPFPIYVQTVALRLDSFTTKQTVPIPSNNSAQLNPSRWGAASKFDFDNTAKWHTVPSVPLLDEHELTNDAGRPIATVDRAALQEIADNGNRKIVETGDPATLILGHTSDDPRAPEKPSQGFVTNLHVKPFKRTADGKIIFALHGDYKLRPNKAHLVEDYPRRSVELWWGKKDVDPVAMLGGSAPERDLGAVIRNGRLNHVSLATIPRNNGSRTGAQREDLDVIRFHRRGEWTIEDYAIDAPPVRPARYSAETAGTSGYHYEPLGNGKMHVYSIPSGEYRNISRTTHPSLSGLKPVESDVSMGHLAPGGKYEGAKPAPWIKKKTYGRAGMNNGKFGMPTSKAPRATPKPGPTKMSHDDEDDRLRYEDAGLDTEDAPGDDYDGGDDAVPTGGDHGTTDASAFGDDGDDSSMSPAVAELLQSKQFRQMQDQLATISQFIESLGGGAGGGPPMGDEMGAEGGVGGEMPPPGADDAGMGAPPPGGAPGAGEPPSDTEESRRGMGERPVQMDAGGGMGGGGFPGQSDAYTPGFDAAGKGKTRRMSRGPQTTTRGTPMTATERQLQEKVTRLERRDRDTRLLYAQSEAAKRVDALVNEGYLFGATPTDHAEGVEETTKHFTNLLFTAPTPQEGIADVGYEEDIIRKRYARRKADPSRANVADISRYGRNPNVGKGSPAAGGTGDGEDFEPVTDEEVTEYADLVGVRKMSRKDAGTLMLRRRNVR